MAAAVERQGLAGDAAVVRHELDLTDLAPGLLHGFDVSASVCTLTQLVAGSLQDHRAEPDRLVFDVVRARNFFVGTNPFVVERVVVDLPGVCDATREGAWRWQLSDTRSFLVWAMSWRRAVRSRPG
jgi:hypothetical protein